MISTLFKATPFLWPFLLEVFRKPPKKKPVETHRFLYSFFMLTVGLSTAIGAQFVSMSRSYTALHDSFITSTAELKVETKARLEAEAATAQESTQSAHLRREVAKLTGQLSVYTTNESVYERELRELRKQHGELQAEVKALEKERDRLDAKLAGRRL